MSKTQRKGREKEFWHCPNSSIFFFLKIKFLDADMGNAAMGDADMGVAAWVPIPGVADHWPSSECHPGPALYWGPGTTQS